MNVVHGLLMVGPWPPRLAPQQPLGREPRGSVNCKATDADGNDIKGPVSAYMHFCSERRASLTAELKASMGSTFKNPAVMTGLGTEWKALGGSEKERFAATAAADKERFNTAIASNPGNVQARASSGKSVDADGNDIKGAVSAYMHFCSERRASLTAELKASMGSTFKNPAVMTGLGAEWKALGGSEKERFAATAAADKQRFDTAIASNPANVKTKRVRASKGPKKLSSYMHFCSERRASLTAELKASMGSTFKNPAVMTGLGAEWKALGAAEKERFVALAAIPAAVP